MMVLWQAKIPGRLLDGFAHGLLLGDLEAERLGL
jgi:hypothetical protein